MPRYHSGASMRCLALLLPPLFVPAYADECDALPPPSVVVKRLEEPVTLNTSQNYRSITILASTEHHSTKRVLGLTRGKALVKLEARTATLKDRTGRWECASPQIVATYGFSPMTVYVASEFPVGSCAYNEIYDHELRHVKTHQAHLAGIERDIAETLARRFATGGPWRGPVGQTRATLEKEINERWIPYITREMERVNADQALIDTIEEYTRVTNSCNGEIKRLIRP